MATEEERLETWAFCPECVRWYYCPCQLDRAASPSRCPVCAADPETVESLPGGA